MDVCFCQKNGKSIEEAIDQLNLGRGNRILIKPNIVSGEPYPTTTDPFVLDTVVSYLKKIGCDLIVADGPAPDKSLILKPGQGGSLREVADGFWSQFRREYHVAGELPDELALLVSEYTHGVVVESVLATVARKCGVMIEDIGDFPMKEVQLNSLYAKMADVDDFDLILNLPVLKLHTVCGFTGALKNLYGLVNGFDKMRLHVEAEDFSLVIKGLPGNVNAPVMTILDATRVPTAQERVWGVYKILDLDSMIVGGNVTQVDAMAVRLLEGNGIALPDNGLMRFLKGYLAE